MITIRSSALGPIADRTLINRELAPGQAVELTDQEIYALADQLAEEEMLEHMVNYRRDTTGVENTIFVSPRGRIRHAARIKVAIDPPHTLSATGKQASVTIHDGNVVVGEVPPQILKQVRQFIELNRKTLIDFWNEEIDGKQLSDRLKPIP